MDKAGEPISFIMRLKRTITLAFVITLAGQAQETASPGRGGQREGAGPGGGRFPVPAVGFATLDTNGDGALDASEIDAAPKSLSQLDKDSDGQITSDEVRAALPRGRGRGGPGGGRGPEGGATPNIVEETVKTLMAFDANGDGKLSMSELPARFQGVFARGDEDKDGFLTPEEIRKMAAAQAPPPESAGRGGRGGPEGERGEGRRGDMNFVRMDPILAAIDANGDGIISAGEIRNAAASIRKLDKDGDGKVTREEAMPAGPGRAF